MPRSALLSACIWLALCDSQDSLSTADGAQGGRDHFIHRDAEARRVTGLANGWAKAKHLRVVCQKRICSLSQCCHVTRHYGDYGRQYWLTLCAWMCVLICACRSTCVHVQAEARGQTASSVLPQDPPILFFRHGLLLMWGSPNRLNGQANPS